MRLLRCHIENFGVLSGFDYEFESGLTVICRENGFGKSTLAAFLKAMFYGLPRTGARTAANNERKRYEPWQGGKYGGFLEFSHGDTSYRVTRYFGKTAAKDSFEIYDLTNRTKETAFSEKLGEELFGLDAESFARSTFVPQLAARELEATSSMRAKLTNLVDDTNDMNNFDTAMAALRAYRSERKAYRGSNGEIDRLTEEIRTLENERFRAEGKRPELESVLREIDAQNAQQTEKTAELALVRADIQKAAGQRERQLKKERLYELRAQVKQQDETMQALRAFSEQRRLEHPQEAKIALDVQPFSSSKKYSAITFETGTYLFGAPEFVLKGAYAQVAEELKPFLDAGCRVLLLAKSRGEGNSPEPLGYAVLTGRVRENAKETFAYFKEQDVTVKVISGDNARTVSEIAKQAGIENADKFVDAAMLVTDEQLARAAETYTVFGRVTPAQKQKLVQAMQKAGHTVAMTGDGVNDILAMKDADCSVAMASGSEAAAQAAQVVLLDSDFARMPDVVLEGRRVVNNIERSASLFLVKNLFSLLLSVFSAVSFLTYPLEPAQVSLIAMFTIGIPGFLLALEPNYVRIEGNFLKKVLLRALPAALTDVLAVGALVICGEVFGLSDGDIATAATMLLAVVGFMILIRISKPLTKMKYAIILVNIAGLIFCGIFLKQLFALSDMSRICVLLMIIFAFAAESVFRNLSILGVFLERKTGALKEKIREKRGI